MNSPMDYPWAIELLGFAKQYRESGGGYGRPAVGGLTLRLAPGQILGLLGPNGSGKSTTLKALAGLLTPTAGECRVFGHQADSIAARALIGYLPETPQYSPHLTGRVFLRYCGGLSSLPPAVLGSRVSAVLSWSELEKAADRLIATYSKGMKQRLGLAQAMLHEPAVLLLDEPASGLDPSGRLILSRRLRELTAGGTTIVLSAHLLTQAVDLCDRLAILGAGQLLVEGTAQALLGVAPAQTPQPSRLEQLYLEKISHHG
ncbi:MAG: ABC transporter ATP-binding protein [Opitutaceae bacterium]|nr:ABC transporter ATP-binding protein [Opitutaceae bacterium]